MNIKINKKTIISVFKFFSPILIGLILFIIVGFLMDENIRIKFWSLITAYFFPPLGKETVIPAGVGFGVHPLVMALSIAFVDIIVALFLVWNYDLAKKIPFVGKFIIKIENVGQKSSSKYGWVKPLRFIGIILFVMVPFQGSGGLVASILGRLIGMKPVNTLFAITAGAIIGCTLIAFFADVILSVFVKNFLIGLLIIIILLIIGIMILIYKNSKNKNDIKKEKK